MSCVLPGRRSLVTVWRLLSPRMRLTVTRRLLPRLGPGPGCARCTATTSWLAGRSSLGTTTLCCLSTK